MFIDNAKLLDKLWTEQPKLYDVVNKENTTAVIGDDIYKIVEEVLTKNRQEADKSMRTSIKEQLIIEVIQKIQNLQFNEEKNQKIRQELKEINKRHLLDSRLIFQLLTKWEHTELMLYVDEEWKVHLEDKNKIHMRIRWGKTVLTLINMNMILRNLDDAFRWNIGIMPVPLDGVESNVIDQMRSSYFTKKKIEIHYSQKQTVKYIKMIWREDDITKLEQIKKATPYGMVWVVRELWKPKYINIEQTIKPNYEDFIKRFNHLEDFKIDSIGKVVTAKKS